MKTITLIVMLCSITTTVLYGQLTGFVHNEKNEPLIGATVQIATTSIGTTTNIQGQFQLQHQQQFPLQLIINYVGYNTKQITIDNNNEPQTIVLQPSAQLQQVVVSQKEQTTHVDYLKAQTTEVLSNKELLKAACCNLSESFENNATVDVSFTDAVTGSKQISMLGLAGVYSQVNYENMPLVRGLGQFYGLSFVPGTWVESIHITKGTGSVINGYESLTGQVDVQFHHPDDIDQLFINGYQSIQGRSELNIHGGKELNDQWGTALFVHTNATNGNRDNNNDGFLDRTNGKQLNIMNRWKYVGKNNLRSQFGVQYVTDEKVGGQTDYQKGDLQQIGNPYGTNVQTNRLQAFSKSGLVFPAKPYKSLGLILNGVHHQQDSFFGANQFNGKQNSFYANLIYQTIISDTRHKIKTGASYQFDAYRQAVQANTYQQNESVDYSVPGVFAEYDYDNLKNVKAIAGIRADNFNTEQETTFSPRLHLKYDVNSDLSVRIGGGKGSRIARVFSDNPSLLVNNRSLNVNISNPIETAWNYGISANQLFTINNREGSLSADFFRTDFQNQIVIDQLSQANELHIRNSTQQSFANSFQLGGNYELLNRLELRLAYKQDNVKQTVGGNLLQKPFVPKQRALLNIAYATNFERLKFDATAHYTGKQQLIATAATSPLQQSPAFFRYNAQATATYKNWDIYLGGENLSNYTQNNPIVGVENPFGATFDASNIWAPIQGINAYVGFRYKVKQENKK